MGARALLPVTAGVLVVHAVLLLALARHGSTPGVARTSPRGTRLIVLAPPKQDDGPAVRASAAPPGRTTAAHRDESGSPAADEGPRPSTAGAPTPADRTADIGIYRAAAALDAPVRARSAPDITALAGLQWSGLPLRMRLFIDAQGDVVDAQFLQGSEPDEVVERVRSMFLATGFTAGVQDGHPVPSYKDVELTIGTPS